MAKVLSNSTATAVKRLLNQDSGSGGRNAGAPVDLNGPQYRPAESAWRQVPVAGGLLVSHGPIPWGGDLVDPDWTLKTIFGGERDFLAFPSVTGNRWLVVSVAMASAAVTVAFSADATYPEHSLAIGAEVFRFPITLWAIATAEGVTTGRRLFDTLIPVAIPGWAPPRAS